MFVTFEGTEGVGKSTNVAFFANLLEEKGKNVVLTREPGGTEIGEEIRSLLLKKRETVFFEDTELLLMFAARAQHVQEKIIPMIEQGNVVISDRFIDATYAYQGGGRGIDMNKIQTLEKLAVPIQPDYTIILDIDPKIGLERIKSRETDRIENEQKEFFNQVREVYLKRAKNKNNYFIVDASVSIDEVQANLRKVVNKIMANETCN